MKSLLKHPVVTIKSTLYNSPWTIAPACCRNNTGLQKYVPVRNCIREPGPEPHSHRAIVKNTL
jgi:hypothetical protein